MTAPDAAAVDGRILIADVETDGLLPKLTRIHCLVVRDAVTRQTYRFRRHAAHPAYECRPITEPGVLTAIPAVDNIAEGVAMLEAGGTIVFHNGIGFDIKAIKKVHPAFRPRGQVRDTLVLMRMVRPDTHDPDMVLWRKGVLPGRLIKSHSLDAWGYRVGLHKGNYAEEMEKLGRDPWASWNLDLEDYCCNDVDITEVLLVLLQPEMPPDIAVELEHDVHDLCSVLEANGFPFDERGALALQAHLQSEFDRVATEVKAQFGPWYAPEKKWRVGIEWDDPEGINKAQLESDLQPDIPGETRRRKYHPPRPEFKEDLSRPWWGDVTVPKRTMAVRTQLPRGLCAPGFTHYTREAGAPYCKIEPKAFNPGSRFDVIDRLQQVYGWVPKDFTEKGTPEVNDGVLRGLAPTIPIADKIAECFFIKKYLGQIADGKQAWLKTFNRDTGCIHCYINVGGTVSSRCAHVGPNLGQVPTVVDIKTRLNDGSLNPQILGANGLPYPECLDEHGVLKDEAGLRGRLGEWGLECRSLFGVHHRNVRTADRMGITVEALEERGQAWRQVGIDLSGIEFRCLAELTAPFDDGELINVIVSGQDIHGFNQRKTGIAERLMVKKCLYGLMYGGGDYRLGVIVDSALASFPDKATAVGARIRAQIMTGLPALAEAIAQAKREAANGYIIGLDGRRLVCRSPHSALNLRLQGNAALIAKRWMVLTEWYALDQGWDHGWAGDFAMLAFVHDEQQNGTRPEIANAYAKLSIKAAADAGLDFGFKCPIGAKAKFGRTWADCH